MLGEYFWGVDSVLGFVISLMLFYAVYEIMREAINTILGQRPSDELISQIKKVIHDTEGQDLMPHQFHIHKYGSHAEMVFHIKIEKDCTVEEAHQIATRIENTIRKRMDIETTIHLESYNGRSQENDPR